MRPKGQIVAIVGRPNVGKSAVFNRLTGRGMAIVEDRPGVTRDRHFGPVEWEARSFMTVDTGGLDPEGEDPFQNRISDQAFEAVQESDQVIFLVDGQVGIHPTDRQAAQILRGCGRPVWLAVNKCDNENDTSAANEFFELGMGQPYPISAIHGNGFGELLEQITKDIPQNWDDEDDEMQRPLRIALVGRPNVGKSSIVNKLLGYERTMVSPVAGTTRDAVDTDLKYQGQVLTLVDTAGLRKKAKVHDAVEKFSVIRTLRAIEQCDVAVLVIDANIGVHEYDEHIAGMIESAGRACVVAINKWDVIEERNSTTMNAMEEIVKKRMPFISWAEVVFISAQTGQRLPRLMEACLQAGEAHCMRIPTSALNTALEEAIASRPEPSRKGKLLKVKYVSQTSVRPPALALFVNDPKRMHFSYKRYLENQFRARFGFIGTPLILMLRQRK